MTTTAKIALGAYAGLLIGSAAYAGYYAYYIIKHGPNARTPLEAWITARRTTRKHLDRALVEILSAKQD